MAAQALLFLQFVPIERGTDIKLRTAQSARVIWLARD